MKQEWIPVLKLTAEFCSDTNIAFSKIVCVAQFFYYAIGKDNLWFSLQSSSKYLILVLKEESETIIYIL